MALPYPSKVFTPFDQLPASDLNEMVANDEYLSTTLDSINPSLPAGNKYLPSTAGVTFNCKIVPSVTSNNLTVAIKGLDGGDPSSSNQVKVLINGIYRVITSALSVTINAGTNWFNSGSVELATKEIDYFVYLGYNTTDGVTIGVARTPAGSLYSDFSATATDQKYCAISTITNAAAGDNYVNIGRFAATLSAGAGYTWTVPTFTASNLVQRAIYETRFLTSNSVIVSESGTISAATGSVSYKINKDSIEAYGTISVSNNGSGATKLYCTLPMISNGNYTMVGINNNDGYFRSGFTNGNYWISAKYDNTYGISSGQGVYWSGNYKF